LDNQIKDKWNQHYHSYPNKHSAATEVLFQNQHLLPEQGTALEIACGRGANAICLAENGLVVSAWDISESAIEQLSLHAKEKKLTLNSEVRNVSVQPPSANTFDVIVVSHFLERALMGDIRKAIKSGGLIFYQTFIKEKIDESGPKNPDYLLDSNELLTIFNDWKIICYREEGKIGNINDGIRNQAMIIAQKP
jgi:tellurite methyltransferase